MTDERTATKTDVALGQRVRARRLEIGMSQERLAELLGVTFQQVQKYEKGVNRIAASRLLDIADALEMPVAQFYEGLGKASKGAPHTGVSDSLATPEGAKMAALFARIKGSRVRRQVLSLAEAMAEDAR